MSISTVNMAKNNLFAISEKKKTIKSSEKYIIYGRKQGLRLSHTVNFKLSFTCQKNCNTQNFQGWGRRFRHVDIHFQY